VQFRLASRERQNTDNNLEAVKIPKNEYLCKKIGHHPNRRQTGVKESVSNYGEVA
jgi:hypothetical protein